MKGKASLSAVCLLILLSSGLIADPNLEAAIREAINKPEGLITDEDLDLASAPSPDEKETTPGRNRSSNVKLKMTSFEVVPLFTGCSIYFKSPPRKQLAILFRRKGGTWQRAFPPVYVKEDGMYRGSIVNLAEDTEYEVKLVDEKGAILAQKTFRTWSSRVPVAKTVLLGPNNFTGNLKVTESGTPEGWIRYTAQPGFVLRNSRDRPLIELEKVRYILLEGLTLRGGAQHAITIRHCENVRVVNCDIAGWGRVGTQRFDKDGKYYTKEGRAINWDCAILISRSKNTVIERCYIHDPVSRANSWYYSHPAGPEALGIDRPVSTVVRYNDFIGSDEHRWNDAVEGSGNFDPDGGFNRDAEIYGNMMCFANDDAIEIDGGQTNVRVFLNKFEGCLCGASIQGCMSGPSYVFRNLLVNMGDDRGLAGQTIKTSSYKNGLSAVSFLFHNTCYGPSSDLNLPSNLRIVALNNIFAGRRAITGRSSSPQSWCDYNLLVHGQPNEEPHGIVADPGFIDPALGLFGLREDSPARGKGLFLENFSSRNEELDLGAIPYGARFTLPYRPVPLSADRYQINFDTSDFLSARPIQVRVQVGGQGFVSRFRVAKNEVFDWFDVSPSEGTLRSGDEITFTVKPNPTRMRKRPVLRAVFLVRLESGYSLPITVYAYTGYRLPARPTREGAWISYLEGEKPEGDNPYKIVRDESASGGACLLLSGPPKANPVLYRFRVPKTGTYFLALRIRSDEPVTSHDSLFFAVDSGSLDRSRLRSATSWTWSLAAHDGGFTCLQPLKLNKGQHTIRLAPRESLYLDLVALTNDPSIFEYEFEGKK